MIRKSIVLVWMLVFVVFAACSTQDTLENSALASSNTVEESETRSVEVMQLTPESFKSTIFATGTALPVREGYLSMAVPGRVKDILVKRGDRVKKGQVLVRLDRSGYVLGVQQAEAALAAAKVGIDALTTEKKRFDRLLSKKAVPKATYDKIKAKYDGAAAQVAMAEVGLKRAKKALSDSQLLAPYDGVITMVMKQVGEYAPAMPPTMLIQIVDTSSLEVQVFLPEREAKYVKVGDQAKVIIDSAEQSRKGEVIFVSDRIQPGSQTFEVRIALPNDDDAIKAGAFARIELTRRQTDSAILIPLRAIVRRKNKAFVFVAKDGRAKQIPVKLGETDGDRVLVLQGLSKGEKLITTGVSELQPDQSIQILQGA